MINPRYHVTRCLDQRIIHASYKMILNVGSVLLLSRDNGVCACQLHAENKLNSWKTDRKVVSDTPNYAEGIWKRRFTLLPVMPPVHTNPSWNRSFSNHSSNRSNLETLAFRFSEDKKHFEAEILENDEVTIIISRFPSFTQPNTNPTWPRRRWLLG